VGELNLRLAKKVRRRVMADPEAHDPATLREMADEFFPLPSDPLRFWPNPEFKAPWSIKGPLETPVLEDPPRILGPRPKQR